MADDSASLEKKSVKDSSGRRNFSVRRRVAGTLLISSAAVILLAVFWLSVFGFPVWLMTRVNEHLSQGDCSFHAACGRLDLARGIVLKDVKIHRKRVVGPPFLDAKEMILTCSPVSLRKGRGLFCRLALSDAEIRPFLISCSPRIGERSEPESASVLDVELHNSKFHDIPVVAMTATWVSTPHGFEVRDIQGLVGEENTAACGAVRGKLDYEERTHMVSGTLDTGFDPALLTNYMGRLNMPHTVELIQRFQWNQRPPVIRTTFRSETEGDRDLFTRSMFLGKDFQYRGVPVTRCEGQVVLNYIDTNALIEVSPLRIERPEGVLSGGFTILARDNLVTYQAESSLDPKAVFLILDLFDAQDMESWRFDGPVTVLTSGTVDLEKWDRTALEASVQGRGMGYGEWISEVCAFRMEMKSFTNRVSDIQGRAYGGTFGGAAEFLAPHDQVSNTWYAAQGWIRDGSFGQIARLVSGQEEERMTGRITANLDWRGILGAEHIHSLCGTGSVAISNGKLFMVPLFGGLSTLMAKIIPGLNIVLGQSDASADFVATNGVIRTEKLLVQGDVLSMNARGKYSVAGDLDFNIEVTLMREHTVVAKLLRIITYPISKLLEFRLTGTMKDPKWYPVNFSGDLLEKIGMKQSSDSSADAEPSGSAP